MFTFQVTDNTLAIHGPKAHERAEVVYRISRYISDEFETTATVETLPRVAILRCPSWGREEWESTLQELKDAEIID